VEKLLKSFTFRELDGIRDIVAEHEKAPGKRAAQKVLAEDMTVLMHGQEGLKAALDATELLFGKKSGPLTAEEMLRMAGDAPMTALSRMDVINQPLVDLAVRVGAAKSKGTGRMALSLRGVLESDLVFFTCSQRNAGA
jgi:tyrosyl-tRNA synthetase